MSDEDELDIIKKYGRLGTQYRESERKHKVGLPEEVKKARVKERAARYREAQRQTAQFFRNEFPEEWFEKYQELREVIDNERGPLPGD